MVEGHNCLVWLQPLAIGDPAAPRYFLLQNNTGIDTATLQTRLGHKLPFEAWLYPERQCTLLLRVHADCPLARQDVVHALSDRLGILSQHIQMSDSQYDETAVAIVERDRKYPGTFSLILGDEWGDLEVAHKQLDGLSASIASLAVTHSIFACQGIYLDVLDDIRQRLTHTPDGKPAVVVPIRI